jgi:hypothetical protein
MGELNMTTVLSDLGEFSVDADGGEGLWLGAGEAAAATGWSLKPEGLCRGDVCVPVPNDRAQAFAADGKVNLAAFWDHMSMPAAHSREGDVWALGEASAVRANDLRSLQAPDFTLPDLNGVGHSLSDHRGKKVLLATWASW